MSESPSPPLNQRRCQACEGGVPKLSIHQSEQLLAEVPNWRLSETGESIERKWVCKSFVNAIDIILRVAAIAEDEQHHPDLHLTGYRNLKIVLTTHAIGGLSDNDFIVAAKINDVVAP